MPIENDLPAEMVSLALLKEGGSEVLASRDASLIDIGDGCACLEFHTKMNIIGPAMVAFMNRAIDRAAREFRALVIGNQGEHFTAGYDLNEFLVCVDAADWIGLDRKLADLQAVFVKTKYARIPVVSAPFGYCLGGGVECSLNCDAIQAESGAIIGLPETHIGVLPAGSGTTALMARLLAGATTPDEIHAGTKRAFDIIVTLGNAKGAASARQMGLLRDSDGISTMNGFLIGDAKRRALGLAAGEYRAPERKGIPVGGKPTYDKLLAEIEDRRAAGDLSDHGSLIAERVAWLLSGAGADEAGELREDRMLDLERALFIELLKLPKSRERMRYTLERGRWLRN